MESRPDLNVGITTLFFYDAQGRLLEEIAAPAMTGSPVRRYVFVEDELLGIASETRPVGAPAWSAPLVPGWLRPEPGAVIFVIALGLVVLTVPLVRRRPLAAVPVVLVAALSLGDSCPSPPPSFAAVHTDALGTPLAVTATTAASPTSPVVLWRASYEPFGAATVNEDPDNDGHGFVLNVRLSGQLSLPAQPGTGVGGQPGDVRFRRAHFPARSESRSAPVSADIGYSRFSRSAYSFACASSPSPRSIR